MDPISSVILELAKTFGISPVATALAIPLLITACNRIARLIPDTATGWKKYVRMVCSIIGAHVKDNSGVPAIVDTAGGVIRRTTVEQVPEEIQGVLALDPAQAQPEPLPDMIPIDLFRRGAAAQQARRDPTQNEG